MCVLNLPVASLISWRSLEKSWLINGLGRCLDRMKCRRLSGGNRHAMKSPKVTLESSHISYIHIYPGFDLNHFDCILLKCTHTLYIYIFIDYSYTYDHIWMEHAALKLMRTFSRSYSCVQPGKALYWVRRNADRCPFGHLIVLPVLALLSANLQQHLLLWFLELPTVTTWRWMSKDSALGQGTKKARDFEWRCTLFLQTAPSIFSISKHFHFQALQAWRAHFCQHRHFCQHIESKRLPLERPRFVQNRRVASVEGNGGNRQKLLSLSSNSHSCRFRNSSLHIFNIFQSSCMQCLPIISISHCQ